MNHGKTKSSKSVVSAASVNEGTNSLAKVSWRVALATVALCGMASFANPAQASYIFIDDGNVGSNEMVNWKAWEAIALNPWFQGDKDHAQSNYWGEIRTEECFHRYCIYSQRNIHFRWTLI